MKVEKKTDVIELSIQSGPRLWKWCPMFVLKNPQVYEGHLNTSSGTEFASFTISEEKRRVLLTNVIMMNLPANQMEPIVLSK